MAEDITAMCEDADFDPRDHADEFMSGLFGHPREDMNLTKHWGIKWNADESKQLATIKWQDKQYMQPCIRCFKAMSIQPPHAGSMQDGTKDQHKW